MTTTVRPPVVAEVIRRPRVAALIAISLVVALVAAASVIVSVKTHTRDVADRKARLDIAELMKSYNPSSGLIGKHWWQSAVALSTVETYAQATGDTQYDYAIAKAFARNSRGDFENNSDDDTAWWGLAWLQAYDITHVPAYLAMAQTVADYIHEDWDNTCGGGVWWQRNPHYYKNAISNELFLELTAWLHNTIPGDTKYLGWAKAEWSWFDHSGMINSSGLVNDGLTSGCQNNGETTWTYNQGVILAGLAQLYSATGDRSLLSEGQRIATAAVTHLTTRDGVLTEPCQDGICGAGLGNDAQSFKGIFVRDLKVLAVTAKTAKFNSFFSAQARAVETDDTNASHQLGLAWTGPPADDTSATQASATDAVVASLGLS